MQKPSREELIELCRDAVVPFLKWNNRDSYLSQVNLTSIYAGLKAGLKYSIKIEGGTIWITFKKPTKKQRADLSNHNLNIDSLDDYRQHFGDESEMFDGNGIDWDSYLGSYMPTRKRLDECQGEDWY